LELQTSFQLDKITLSILPVVTPLIQRFFDVQKRTAQLDTPIIPYALAHFCVFPERYKSEAGPTVTLRRLDSTFRRFKACGVPNGLQNPPSARAQGWYTPYEDLPADHAV
jgi:hypothetical protein